LPAYFLTHSPRVQRKGYFGNHWSPPSTVAASLSAFPAERLARTSVRWLVHATVSRRSARRLPAARRQRTRGTLCPFKMPRNRVGLKVEVVAGHALNFLVDVETVPRSFLGTRTDKHRSVSVSNVHERRIAVAGTQSVAEVDTTPAMNRSRRKTRLRIPRS
jgi:hypothetical protein